MDIPQIYTFQGTKQLNEFIKDNCRDMTVEKIEIQPVPSQGVFFFFLTAKVRLGMCEVIWRRYAELVGVEA